MSEGPSVSVPRAPTVLQVVRLQAGAHSWEVAPGRIAHGATFEDQVPGPTIEARAGGTLTVFSSRLTEPTGVRWIVLDSPDDATAAAPGTSQQYTVHLSRRGLYLYRSAAGPLGGVVGAVIVRNLDEPADNNTILIVDRSTHRSRVEGGIGASRNVLPAQRPKATGVGLVELWSRSDASHLRPQIP